MHLHIIYVYLFLLMLLLSYELSVRIILLIKIQQYNYEHSQEIYSINIIFYANYIGTHVIYVIKCKWYYILITKFRIKFNTNLICIL